MYKRTLAAALIFGVAALAPPAEAQSRVPCFERDKLINTLSSKYNESLTGGGLQSSNRLLEIWSSDETGSFTVFITHPNGMSCIVASGENWNLIDEPVVGGVAG